MKEEIKSSLSRRKFLQGAGASAAGLTAIGTMGLFLNKAMSPAEASANYPLKYVKLDPDKARERAYKNYFKGGWGIGAAEGLFGYLADEIGAPYNLMPPAMFIGFSGGIEHWGTICGALVPPVALISGVVADKKIRAELINELLAWYIQFPFPEYQPAGLNLSKVAVGSPLCHISVSKWCNKEGVDASSKKKKERCGGLSGDVVKKTVLILNTFADKGTFVAVHKPDPIVATCMGCHTDSPPYTQGKDNCMQCHGSTLKNLKDDPLHKDFIKR